MQHGDDAPGTVKSKHESMENIQTPNWDILPENAKTNYSKNFFKEVAEMTGTRAWISTRGKFGKVVYQLGKKSRKSNFSCFNQRW